MIVRRKQLLLIASLASFALLSSSGPSVAADPARPASPWEPLRFFIGSWTGQGNGQPGVSTIRREYRWTLNDRFIEVRNQSTYAPQPGNPKGEVHQDHGMISWDRGRRRFVLRQFHIEGFVNQYVADSLAARADSIVFTSEAIENIPAGFRARETYVIRGADEFIERFELAEPDSAFVVYTEGRFKRVK
jgi:hypothetical protein